MALAVVLWPLVGLVSMVALVWLCVVAFQRHPGWGLAVFFLSPFAALIFAIKYWEDSKKPFLIYSASVVMMIGLMVYTFSAVGGFEMLTMAQQIEAGELSEDEAMAQMLQRMESSGMLTEEQEAELRQMQEQLAREQAEPAEEPIALGGTPEAREAPRPQATDRRISLMNEVAARSDPEPSATGDAVPAGYKRVTVNEASGYLGRRIRIVSKGGSEIRGLLADVANDVLLVERHLDSGTVSFELRRTEVDSILVAYR